MHSFTGSVEDAEEVLGVDARVFIGINGCSMKTVENLDAMATVPLDRLMIETDAPWCDCRRTHASAEHISITRDAKDRKKHDPAHLVKGRNEPCNIDQVQALRTAGGTRCRPCTPTAHALHIHRACMCAPSAAGACLHPVVRLPGVRQHGRRSASHRTQCTAM